MSRHSREERTATGVVPERTATGQASDRTRPERTAPGSIDEEVPDLGPEADAVGLLDPPPELTATGDETADLRGIPGIEESAGAPNAALLAWIAAPPEGEPPAPLRGEPVAAIKKSIADLPLDALPSLDRDLGKVARIVEPPIRVVPPPPPPAERGTEPGAESTGALSWDTDARWRVVGLAVVLVALAVAAAWAVYSRP
jgi:hypothetical protein